MQGPVRGCCVWGQGVPGGKRRGRGARPLHLPCPRCSRFRDKNRQFLMDSARTLLADWEEAGGEDFE